MGTSSSTGQQHSSSGRGVGAGGSSSHQYKEGEVNLESPESPAALFDTFGHNWSLHDRHSPMLSMLELMSKVPLEESQMDSVLESSAESGAGDINTGRARMGLGLGL
ncbi:hypothetical protein FRB94_010975, partial [Tulasnella sp. JGI-2019a]